MINTTTPNSPRRRLLIFLWLVVMLFAAGWLTVKATQDNPPPWIDLQIPLSAGVMGLIFWLSPQDVSPFPAVWRRRAAILFFALSAVELILFFT